MTDLHVDRCDENGQLTVLQQAHILSVIDQMTAAVDDLEQRLGRLVELHQHASSSSGLGQGLVPLADPFSSASENDNEEARHGGCFSGRASQSQTCGERK
jgi:hypothetical protein